jgi:two-component system sensor histidine kinase/response regulator
MADNQQPSLAVLLVEDNPTHVHIIRRQLEKAADNGLTLHHVDRLATALTRLEQSDVDALLLDLSLPDSEISQTLPTVLEAHGDLPIVVLTSLDDLDFATRAVQQGAQDYLVKSDLSGPLLLRSIRYAIERKKTQDKLESYAAELERSNEHLRGFAHTVAHEVKSPLSVVVACLQMLDHKHRGSFDDETRGFVADANAAIHGMTELVNELLEFARVGSEVEEFEEVDVEAVFYQAYVMLRPAIRQTGASVTHDPLPTVRGNAVQLRQLLQNLIGNAIKYRGPRHPRIHVGVEGSSDQWTFSVQDNGLGILRADQERVFDAFVRLHKQSEIPGTGIGLAFCKRIVEHHGGQLWVDSAPGGGSIFHFTLPKFSL